MAKRGKFSQDIVKDVSKQDRDAEERSESPITESERYLREMGKPSASTSTAAKDVRKAGESSDDRNVELKKGGIEASAGAARCSVGGSANSELSISAPGFSGSPRSALPRASESADAARMAAHNARNAAQTSIEILKQIHASATVGRDKMEEAYRRNSAANDSNYYLNMAAMYGTAIQSVSLKLYDVDIAAGHTARSAEAAASAAQALSEVRDETSPEESCRVFTACNATVIAKANTGSSFRMENTGLECAMKLWQDIDRAENSGTAIENRRRRLLVYGENNCFRSEGKCAKCLQILSFVVGCGILASLGFKFPTVPFYAVIIVGSVMVGFAAIQAIYRLHICRKDRRFLARESETTIIIGRIEVRLRELSQYFQDNPDIIQMST